MLLYKILAFVMLICFAVAAYFYVIFQMPAHGHREKSAGNRSDEVNRILIKTIIDS